MIEAEDRYVSVELGTVLPADVTYPATYQYLEGNKLAGAHELMEALAADEDILIVILRKGAVLKDYKLDQRNSK